NLRRAVDLTPEGPLRSEARVKLGDLLAVYLERVSLDRQILAEADSLADQLIALDPQSFDGQRLKGEVGLLKAKDYARRGFRNDAGREARNALTALRAADAIRPGQQALSVDLARGLLESGQEAEAERVLVKLIEARPHAVVAYTNLYRLYAGRQRLGE